MKISISSSSLEQCGLIKSITNSRATTMDCGSPGNVNSLEIACCSTGGDHGCKKSFVQLRRHFTPHKTRFGFTACIGKLSLRRIGNLKDRLQVCQPKKFSHTRRRVHDGQNFVAVPRPAVQLDQQAQPRGIQGLDAAQVEDEASLRARLRHITQRFRHPAQHKFAGAAKRHSWRYSLRYSVNVDSQHKCVLNRALIVTAVPRNSLEYTTCSSLNG